MAKAAGRRGVLVVLSGPSGAGKTSVVHALEADRRVEFSVSATTRPMRAGERDGADYHFLTREEFEARRRRSEFIESAEYDGNLYGTLRAPMEEALARGRWFVLEIEVDGTRQLRRKGVPGTYVFLAPPSLEELERRLRARGQNDPADIARRLEIAAAEMKAQHLYDHVVVNQDLERAIAEVKRLIGL